MKTAVQLRTSAGDERPRAELLFGAACDIKEATLGPVARFESAELVFYTRLGAMFGGRLPGHKILLSLLRADHPSRAQESSTASKADSVAPAEPA